MKTRNLGTLTYVSVAVPAQKCSMGYSTSDYFVTILSAPILNFLYFLTPILTLQYVK
jgi:hypothetical protein